MRLLESIEEGDAEHAKEELGDVIMNAVEIAALYEKQGKFSANEVLDGHCKTFFSNLFFFYDVIK